MNLMELHDRLGIWRGSALRRFLHRFIGWTFGGKVYW